jgi:hypothetical protein
LRLLALFEVIPLSPCGKRNPLSQSTPLWQVSAFRISAFRNAKSKFFEKLELQTGTGKADFTIVGVSVGSLLRCFGWSAEQSNKASQKQVIT